MIAVLPWAVSFVASPAPLTTPYTTTEQRGTSPLPMTRSTPRFRRLSHYAFYASRTDRRGVESLTGCGSRH